MYRQQISRMILQNGWYESETVKDVLLQLFNRIIGA